MTGSGGGWSASGGARCVPRSDGGRALPNKGPRIEGTDSCRGRTGGAVGGGIREAASTSRAFFSSAAFRSASAFCSASAASCNRTISVSPVFPLAICRSTHLCLPLRLESLLQLCRLLPCSFFLPFPLRLRLFSSLPGPFSSVGSVRLDQFLLLFRGSYWSLWRFWRSRSNRNNWFGYRYGSRCWCENRCSYSRCNRRESWLAG